METSLSRKYAFNILVEKMEGAFVAHSIETGLVASALDESEVLVKIGKMHERLILFAAKHNRYDGIYGKPPAEVYQKYWSLKQRSIQQTQRSLPVQNEERSWFTLEQNAYAPAC